VAEEELMSVTPTSTDAGSTQRRADARRNIEAILSAAEACLARDPDASMGEIAAAAALGRVTVYGHFASRNALVEAVVHRVLAATNAALDSVDLSGDAAGALARLVEATWRLTIRSGSLLVAADKALPAATVRQAHQGGLEQRVRDFFTAAQDRGEFRSDLPVEWLLATFHAVLHAAANEVEAGRLDADKAASIITTTMLGILGKPTGTRGRPGSRETSGAQNHASAARP
jgi:TetR/AcrR family transcriptional repressor of mexCD-oprJ operon